MAGGRPRKYDSPEEMQAAIDRYFDETERPTVCGLAIALGFTSRADLIRYEGYSEDFCYAIKRAKLRIEASYEEGLIGPHPAGCIFALKNFGWRDTQKIHQQFKVAGKVQIVSWADIAGDGAQPGQAVKPPRAVLDASTPSPAPGPQ